MTSSGGRFAQILVVFWSLAALESAGGKSVTWYEPLPAKTVSSAGDDLTPAETRVFEGYPTSLSWNFSLTSVTLFSAGIKFNTKGLANSGPGGLAAKVLDPFKDRFNFTWISQRLTLVIFNVTAADDESNGVFQCELSTGEGFWRRAIRIKIIERAKIVDVTSDQDVCEDTKVTLSCNATGKPDPNITWTRVWENGTDSGVLQSKDGYFVMDNIGRGSNGTFRCTAFNGVGEPVNQTVKVIVRYSEIRVVSSSNTVLEGDAYTLSCNATGDPMPTVTWIKVGNNQRSDGNVLNFTNINRNDAGNYTCEANNSCGTKTKTEAINVSFKPDNVTLERNTTENNGCTDLWVNFTCNSSEANPPVYNYELIKNETDFIFSRKGTWIEKISRGETFVYRCQAYQQVDNVTSTKDITLTVNDQPAIEQVLNVTVQEEGDVTKECDVTAGTPPPNVFWKNINTSEVIYGKLLNITNIRRNQSGEYRCFANNTCGNESSTMFIDVQYPSKITYIMNNMTVNDNDKVTLDCQANGNPSPNISWIFVSNNSFVPRTFRITGKQDEGYYRCIANNDVGSSSTREVYITVLHYRPLNTTLMINTGDSSVILKKTFTIRCDAPANPPASYEILRDDGTIVGRNSTVKTSVTEGIENNTVDFTCKPSNVYGKGPTVTIPVEVLTPPSITNEFSCEKYVKKGETAVFSCIPAGHPTPNITWTGMGIVQDSDGYNLNIKLKKNGTHRYKCKAENGIENSIEVTVVVVVEDQVALLLRYRISFPKEEFIGKLNDEGSDNYKELAEKVQKVKEAFPKCFTIEIKVERFSPNYEGPGVVAFICLIFNATMGAEAATSYLINAAKEGKLGNVDADSITYLEAITERKRCMAIYNDDQLCKTVKSVWIAVFSVGGVAIVAVIALGAYHVHKRRKCRRKDNSVHSGNEEEQAFSSNHSTLSDGKPCDYAMSGPQPSVDLDNEQQLGAVPTYAVVDKSRKKDKKKKKEAAEQKPVDDQYAVVDKSKKKKKNEADNTYAEVDTSKKSKKKPKPIEVLYADLGEFHSMKKMPAVSTSPKALPPIKRPEAYAETQYADITQFMKGNPEDPGAELPKDITTPAVNNTATGSKEESSAGNTGDGAKATNETGF